MIEISYSMATPPSSASTSIKSRGHFLFNQQAHIHVYDPDKSSSQKPPSSPKPQILTKLVSSPVVTQTYQTHTPVIMHNRSASAVSESYAHTDDDDIKLIGVHPRPESDYLQRLPPRVPKRPVQPIRSIPPPTLPVQIPQKLLETDFPVDEPSDINNEPEKFTPVEPTSAEILINKNFEYLDNHDDDDDVIHQENSQEQYYDSDSFDDENDEIDISTTEPRNVKYDSGIHTLPLTEPSRKSNENESNQQSSTDHQPLMAHLSQTTASEEYDSEFDDDSSPEDDEQITRKDSNNNNNDEDDFDEDDEEEQQNQILLRQQEILWGIVQEWVRKEKDYIEQLQKLEEQLSLITIPTDLQNILKQLIYQHKRVFRQIQELYRRSTQPNNLSEPLTECVEALMNTLPIYNNYMESNLTPIRKSLERRNNGNGSLADDLLSIPTKQFLQILSQVQDLYQTAQPFESGDTANLKKLYNLAQSCRVYASRQDDKINQLILKNEDVATMSERGSRDRCRLILYPDAIVCCTLKSKLLTSPKYVLLSFIPIHEIQWTVPQTTSEDNRTTGDEYKSTLKSYYKELEQQAAKSNASTPSRLSKTIRKQQDEFYLSQSNLQLVFVNTTRSSYSLVILFSSAYQRQDWIDLIDKTKQDLLQRRSTHLSQTNLQRLNESIIQKRLDLIKPNQNESNSNDLSSTNQASAPLKSYSGTLSIAVHSIQGPALLNSGRGFQTLPTNSMTQQQLYRSYQFYVAVEVDSYNTFYPYAQTSKQMIQQQDTVEFKGEDFQVELEHSRAFRLLIYRTDTSSGNNNNNSSTLQRANCIGKFHRDIEPTLRDCQMSSSGVILIESQSGDLKLKTSLKYLRRDGTFKRQGSKRSRDVFGKSIEKFVLTANGLIDGIPRIIVKCVEMVEREGLNETGIYRVCCVASDLQKLRHEFDKNIQHAETMLAQKNVHVAANLLKLFFRELPEPLFTSTLYKQFLNAIQLTDLDNQRIILVRTFDLLHAENKRICLYLFDHLIRVSQHSNTNKMHLDNLAVVFGPTLMRPAKLTLAPTYSNQRTNNSSGPATQTDLDQMSLELQGSMFQCQVVLACLKLRRDGILK